jgi:putative lipoic acid-binding regulatory protein
MSETQNLLEFPCSFPIKAMGKNSGNFEELISGIVFRHAELYEGEEVKARTSGSDNFLAVTITVQAVSQEQLDKIYQELTACEQVLMAL